MAEFNSTLLEHHPNGQNTYMCGDYNVDLLKINSLQFNENYFDSILSAGYIPTITLPIRLSENSTLIDNIFTTNLDNNISECILNIDISDNQPVVLFVNDDLSPTKSNYITVKSNTVKKHKKNPWITVGILKSINQGNKLYKKFKLTRIDLIIYVAKKTIFNRFRNTLKKTI